MASDTSDDVVKISSKRTRKDEDSSYRKVTEYAQEDIYVGFVGPGIKASEKFTLKRGYLSLEAKTWALIDGERASFKVSNMYGVGYGNG